METAEQIRLNNEKNKIESDAKELNRLTMENTRLSNEAAGIISSEKIEQATNQLDALKQATAYLGTR